MMMMRATFALTLLLSAQVNCFEEPDTEFEDLIISTVAGLIPEYEGEKFISYQHHLGVPAMHAEIEDGKLPFLYPCAAPLFCSTIIEHIRRVDERHQSFLTFLQTYYRLPWSTSSLQSQR